MSPDVIVKTLRKFGLKLDVDAAGLIEKLQSDRAKMRTALARIREFPYVGQQAAQQMALIAGETLATISDGGE